MGNVYGYVRVSTDGQEDGSSLADQEAACMAIATLAKISKPLFFADVISGSIPLERRPKGRELLAILQPGDSVIVSKLDRMFRNATDALNRADKFRDDQIALYLADMGNDPVTSNGTSRLFFGMLALVAEFERHRLRERTADGRAGKKQKGGHLGGDAPFGYRVIGTGRDATLMPDDAQQAAIADMLALRAQGRALRAIASEIESRHGIKVSAPTINRIVSTTTNKTQ